MPFMDTRDRTKQINIADKYKPVLVFSHTDFDGNIRPLKFKYENTDETIEYFNIDSVRYAKDIRGGVNYSCLITNYGRQQVIDLVYYYEYHRWFIVV